MELVAGDLLLRPPRPADLPAVVEACRDPAIARFIPVIPSPYEDADARAWLAAAGRGWAGGDARAFVIAERASGRLLGSIELRLREGGSVGYWLAPAARGQGVATRALRAVADWAHETHGVRELVLTAHPDNAASQRVAERAGFVRAGTTRHAPPFRDGLETAVLFRRRLGA